MTGKNRSGINWQIVNWAYSNESLSRLLDVANETVCRMRTLHAPETCWGPGRSPDVAVRAGYARSGQHAPRCHVDAASVCRQLVFELAGGTPQTRTVAELRRLLDALEAIERALKPEAAE